MRFRPPPGACDCHAHIFGPPEKYPYATTRSYTPADAPLESYRAMLDELGFERGVLVQPSVYGVDNRLVLDTVARDPARLRAVIAIDRKLPDEDLRALERSAVRGLRLSNVVKGGVPLEHIDLVASIAERSDWHIELALQSSAHLTALMPKLLSLRVPVVIDHFALIQADAGVGQPVFQDLLELLSQGHAWVKISHAYGVSRRPDYSDLAPMVYALVEANPRRILWGTDWPHPSEIGKHIPEDATLLEAFTAWVPDAQLQKQILVDNPASLYRFDA